LSKPAQDHDVTEQPEAKKRPDKRERVTGRLRQALDLMVFGDETGKPLDYIDAGRTMNISARSMRRSLERPAVRQYLQAQKQVARASASAGNIWHLADIAKQRSNMNAAVNAIRAIDEGDPEAFRAPSRDGPGITIRIIAPPSPAAAPPMVDVTPQPAPIPLPRDPQSQGSDE
jgi:hypothetical protein